MAHKRKKDDEIKTPRAVIESIRKWEKSKPDHTRIKAAQRNSRNYLRHYANDETVVELLSIYVRENENSNEFIGKISEIKKILVNEKNKKIREDFIISYLSEKIIDNEDKEKRTRFLTEISKCLIEDYIDKKDKDTIIKILDMLLNKLKNENIKDIKITKKNIEEFTEYLVEEEKILPGILN